jgi:UDP-glucuronate 4-epimerase
MMKIQGETFLVTGAAGFIGSHVTRALLQAGASVVAVDDFNDFYDPAIKVANVQPLLGDPRFVLYRADIRDPQALEPAFANHAISGIVHLAARAGVRPSLLEPQLYVETNVNGTVNLLTLARQHGIERFVFASSSSVYGDNPAAVPFQEDQPINRPISPYAATKAMGENILYTYSHLYDMRVVCLRFFTVYGAGQRPDLAIHKFTRLLSEGRPIPVFGDGSTRRDYTYIDDIVQGVMAAIAYDKTPFEVFNLGESQTTALSELIAHLARALDVEPLIERHPLQPGDVPITYASIDKACSLLGYNPSTQIADGIPRFVAWYQQMRTALTSV